MLLYFFPSLCCVFLVTRPFFFQFVGAWIERALDGKRFFVFPQSVVSQHNVFFFVSSLRDPPHARTLPSRARERDRERQPKQRRPHTMFLINWCVCGFAGAPRQCLAAQAPHRSPPSPSPSPPTPPPQDLLCAQQPGAVQQERQDSVPGALFFWGKRARHGVRWGRAVWWSRRRPPTLCVPRALSPMWCASRPRGRRTGTRAVWPRPSSVRLATARSRRWGGLVAGFGPRTPASVARTGCAGSATLVGGAGAVLAFGRDREGRETSRARLARAHTNTPSVSPHTPPPPTHTPGPRQRGQNHPHAHAQR